MNIMITGATSGIGYALALSYAKQGHQVIACGRNHTKLGQLSALSHNISPLCFDLVEFRNYPEIETRLDLLILNAGDCEYIDNSLDFDAKKFDRVININLISVAYGLEKWLKQIKSKGRLVLISSSAALLPLPRAEAYGASKAGLTYLAKTLAISLKKYDIEVTRVHPGFVDTPLTKKNNFPMPMLVSQESAANKIIKGVEKGKKDISFPFFFFFMMRFLAFIPFSIWQKIASRMV